MIYIKNLLFINLLRILNKFDRGLLLKKKTFSSQKILEKNFSENENFNFIQVGANDGISFDFLYSFVIKRKSQGVVIEPVSDYFMELQKNYEGFPAIIKVNKAVHPYEKEVVINKISPNAVAKYPDWVKGIASLDVNHHLKTNILSNDIVQETVEADSLMNIVKNCVINQHIDYFQVDTEGFDYEVLKQLDFNFIKPSIIKYEKVNLNNNENSKLENMLRNKKFFLFDEFGDKVAINIKEIKLY